MAASSARTVSGTTDTPTIADDGGYVDFTNAGTKTVTLTNSSWVAGRSHVALVNVSGGALTIAGGVGVTIEGDTSVAAGTTVLCRYRAANVWTVVGTDVLPVASGGTGATTASGARRNLQALGPVFDVTAYGAVGNGSTDDTAAVQAAADDAGDNHGLLWFPAGDYVIGNIVVTNEGATPWNDGVTVAGEGHQSRLIAKSGTTGQLVTLRGGYMTIRDLFIDGNNENVTLLRLGGGSGLGCARSHVANLQLQQTSGSTSAHGLELYGVSGGTTHAVQVTSLRISDLSGNGIETSAFTYDSQWQNIWIGSCNIGVNLGSGANRFTNLHSWGNASHGVYVALGSYNKFANSYLESNGGYGLSMASVCYSNELIGCDLWANGSGGANLAGRSKVTGGSIRENVGPGILLNNATFVEVIGVEFYDGQATKTQTHHIQMTGTSDSLFLNASYALASQTSTGVPLALIGRSNIVEGCKLDPTFIDRYNAGASSRTLALTDINGVIEFTSFSASATLTVPPDSSVYFPIGTMIPVINYGNQPVTITPGSGVAVRGGALTLQNTQHAWGILVKRFDNDWHFLTSYRPGDLEIDGALNHDGSTVGFFGVTPAARAAAYTATNVTTDRAFDANATTLDELADVVGTLIADLKTYGLLQ